MRYFYILLTVIVLYPLSLQADSFKQTPQNEIEKLKFQLSKIMARIDHLEQARHHTTTKSVKPKNSNTKIVVTGRVNRAILWANNGHNSATQHVDNGNANSIINMTATHSYNKLTNAGAEIEAKMRQNSSDSTDIKNSSNGSANFAVRKLNAFLDNKKMGRIELGRGSSASNMTMEATDLSDTDVVNCGASIASMAGGTTFVNKSTNAKMYTSNLLSSSSYKNLINSDEGKVNINAVFGGLDTAGIDGLGFQDRILYQTPKMNNFIISTSHAYASPSDGQGNDLWDIAIKYAAQFNKVKYVAQIAFIKNNTVSVTSGANTGYNQINGSAGVMLPSGINAQISSTVRQWKYNQAHDARQYGLKLGYEQSYSQAGKTAFSIDYGHFANFVIDASTPQSVHNQFIGHTYGAFIVQFLDRISSQVYLGWRHHTLTIKGSSVKAHNIDAVMGGMMVKF